MRAILVLVYLYGGQLGAEAAFVPTMAKCKAAILEVEALLEKDGVKPVLLTCISEEI